MMTCTIFDTTSVYAEDHDVSQADGQGRGLILMFFFFFLNVRLPSQEWEPCTGGPAVAQALPLYLRCQIAPHQV